MLLSSLMVVHSSSPFMPSGSGGYGIAIGGWTQPQPLALEVIASDGSAAMMLAPYSTVTGMTAQGAVTTAHGSSFHVTDKYALVPDGFTVSRTVDVTAVAPAAEVAFSSRFALQSTLPGGVRAREFFMPGGSQSPTASFRSSELHSVPDPSPPVAGVWYRNSTYFAPPKALAGNLDAEYILVR
jgi:hypothetical protein